MPKLAASIEVEVPFHDVDAMNVVWHGHYIKYFELARCALLRRFNYDYPQMQASGFLWPVVECSLKYVRPARYGQKLRVEATLLEHENRLRIGYAVYSVDSGERLTKGETLQVVLEVSSMELQFISPDVLLRNVEKAST